MPSTVYKGDLTEISFGHETGLVLTHNYNSSSFTFTHTSTDSTAGTSLITLTNGAASTPVQSGVLKYPIGMLVGAKLSIIGTTVTLLMITLLLGNNLLSSLKHQLLLQLHLNFLQPHLPRHQGLMLLSSILSLFLLSI